MRTLIVAISAAATAAALAEQPATPKARVVDTLQGVQIEDDYRWLEDWKDAKVQQWSDAQNAHARAVLDVLPGVAVLRERITDLVTRRPPSLGRIAWRPGRFFAMQSDPARKQQPSLVVLDSLEPDAKVRVLLDLMALDPSGKTAIDWYVPSIDGAKVAISLSQRGSEAGTVHVYDVATAKETGDAIPRAQNGTAGGSLSWNADGSGFYYTRYPHEGERPPEEMDFWQQVYFHKLGTPDAQDVYSMGKELPRIAEISLQSTEDGKHQLALVENGDGGDHALWILPAGGSWVQVSRFEDGIVGARFGRDGAVWMLSKKDAPRRRVLRLPLATPQLAKAKVVIDQLEGVIQELMPTQGRLYVVEMLGGPTRIRQFDHAGKALPAQMASLPVSTNSGLKRLEGDDVFFISTSHTRPLTGYRYEAKTGAMRATVVQVKALANFSDIEVLTEHATSKDGTKVPMFIIQRKGTKRDGSNPTLLMGYGGYGISTQPYYRDVDHVYLEQGVVLVETALRGGGEFGEEWHKAGNLTRKQNVFDDFIACAERLIELGYTTPKRLAIEGGSNGGLLMGAALTQRPDLFRAVVSHVGIYDMLRVELSPNGAFNVTEFGTVKDPEQFKALYAYSPYHHVKEGAPYGSVLFMTGANDPRVDPMQSRKMSARLQAVGAGQPRKVLLRTSADTGHGMGSPVRERISQLVDEHAFVLHELGVKVKAPPAATPGG